jgi:hypothetical protein
LAAGCSSTTLGSDDFAREDAVDCRELGGVWVFIRYEQPDSFMQGVRLGVPTSDEGLFAEPEVGDAEFDEATRQRVGEGWDAETVSRLQGPDAPTELMTRLADMPFVPRPVDGVSELTSLGDASRPTSVRSAPRSAMAVLRAKDRRGVGR